jgi:hypothetical protein
VREQPVRDEAARPPVCEHVVLLAVRREVVEAAEAVAQQARADELRGVDGVWVCVRERGSVRERV